MQQKKNYMIENKKTKIFVSILNEGFIKSELAFMLIQWLNTIDYQIYLEMPSDRPIENNRNMIVQRFLKSDADYLIQIDNDNVPPENPLKLISLMKEQNIDILSCPVWIYQHKLILNIYKLDKTDGMLVPVDPEKEKGLIEIDATGTGILLTSRKVLEVIKKPFERKYDENGIEELGQDLYFSRKAKNAGFKIFSHLNYISKHYKLIDLGILQKVNNSNNNNIRFCKEL